MQGALDLQIDLATARVQPGGSTGDVSRIGYRLIGREIELSLLNRPLSGFPMPCLRCDQWWSAITV